MHLCSAAWRPLLRRLTQGAAPFARGYAPFRQMSSGSVPGSSGENFIYYLLTAAAAGAGGFYAYRTVSSDKARYNERIGDIQQRTVAEWKPKPWPPQSLENDETEENETTDASEVKDAVEEETEALTTGESEKHTESTEAERENELPVEEESSSVQEEQDASSSSEAAQTEG